MYQSQSKRREQSEAEFRSPYILMVFIVKNMPTEEQAVSSSLE